jgi:hypothetical protein
MTQHKIPNPNIQIPKRLKLQAAMGWAAVDRKPDGWEAGHLSGRRQDLGSGMFQLK